MAQSNRVEDGAAVGRADPQRARMPAPGRRFRIGPFQVEGDGNRILHAGRVIRVEPKAMDVLICLAARAGEPVSREALLEHVWPNRIVTDDALNSSIAKLRKIFRADPQLPELIETIPKRGYRLTAEVEPMPAAAGRRPGRRRSGLRWGVVAVALASLAASLLLWARSSSLFRADDAVTYRQVPFTSLVGHERGASFAPDGSQVVFAWDRGEGRWDLYIKAIDGAALRRLTDTPADDYRPVWSPAGSDIAFVRRDADGCSLRLISALGGAERELARCHRSGASWLAWSPDGRALAYTDRPADDAPAAVFVLPLGEPQPVQLTRPPAGTIGDEELVFAPDGREIAFVRSHVTGVMDLYIAPVGGGEARRLTDDRLKIHGLSWPPGGRIVFSSNRGGLFGLWRIPTGGGSAEPLLFGTQHADAPVHSADGRRLLFQQETVQTNIRRLRPGDVEAQRPIVVGSSRWDFLPQLSPDGTTLAFISDRSGAAELWISAIDGAEPQQLTRFGGPYTQHPAWSPDGREIAVEVPVGGNFDIYAVTREGVAPRRLTRDASAERAPAYSRDGRWLYFSSDRGGRWQVYRMARGGGAVEQLTVDGGYASRESPDGRQLLHTRPGVAGLWRLDPELGDGGAEQLSAHPAASDAANWAVGRERLFLIERDGEDSPWLVAVPLTGGPPRRLAPLPGLLYKSGLAVSSDEREFYYTSVDRSETDLILVETR